MERGTIEAVRILHPPVRLAEVTEGDVSHYERHLAEESDARGWFQGCVMTAAGVGLNVATTGLPTTALGVGVTSTILLVMVLGSVYFGAKLYRLGRDRPRLLQVFEGGRAAAR